jgi:hypothetical protein
LVSCSSLVTIQLAMVRSCTCSSTRVSSTIISPTFGWKKVLGRCCFIVWRRIARLIAKTHNELTCCFGIGSAILKFGIWTSFETNSIWVGISIVLIENRSYFVANIPSSFSSNILEWKS